jgi:hypothetical protein
VSPLPGHRVFPSGWAQHHRPTVNGTMTATIAWFHRGTPEPYELPEGWTGPEPFHTSPCRVQELNASGRAVPTDQPVFERDYLVSIPIEGAPEIRAGEQDGDYGKVTDCEDPLLVGRILNVTDVQHGSLMFERDIICTDTLTQN